jgi:hypothetical protein
MKGRWLSVVLVLSVHGASAFAGGGQISEGTYSNLYVGISFPLPSAWYVATDADVHTGLNGGARIAGFKSEKAKAMIANTRGKVLLWLLEHPLDGDYQGLDRNMIVAVIDARTLPEQAKTGEDFLKLAVQGMKKYFPNDVSSGVLPQKLGGASFHKLDLQSEREGTTIYQRMLAGVVNDYLFVITLGADNSRGLEELARLADTVSFHNVTKAIDSSPDAESFRRGASIATGK